MHLGPSGAALGTTLSQAISVVVSLIVILRRKNGIRLQKQDLRPQRSVMGELLWVGLPITFQDLFVQISFMFITAIANRRGLTDAAAVGIVEKFIGFVFLVPSSMQSTVSAIGAQNIGAGKPERAVRTMWYASALCAGFGLVVAVSAQLIAEPIVRDLHGRYRRHARGRTVSARLCDRLPAGGDPLLLQRLFLRHRQVRHFFPAQYDLHSFLRAFPARIWPRCIFRIRCCRWALLRRQAPSCPLSSA